MMRELNISTFIQVMQIGLKEHDTQFAADTFLLEVLNQSDDERFDIYREDLSDKKISLLVSRQRPVPDGIKQASLVPGLAQAAREHYENKVLKDMNSFRKDDVLNQLVKVIKEDKEIGDKKRDELLDYYNKGQEGRFLGEVFLYVVNRPNKPGDDFVGFEDAPLIAEANYECPICHKKLVDTVREMRSHGFLKKSKKSRKFLMSSLGNSLKMQQKNRPYKRIQQVGEKNVHFKIVQGNFPEKRA